MTDKIYSTPILTSDVGKRLDAIVRRHGGKPKSEATSKVILPPVGKRDCEGQMTIDDAIDEGDAEASA